MRRVQRGVRLQLLRRGVRQAQRRVLRPGLLRGPMEQSHARGQSDGQLPDGHAGAYPGHGRPAPRRTLVLAPDAGHAGNPLLSTMAVPAPADAVPLCAFVQPLWPPGCPALWADPWFPRRPGSHHALHQGSTAWHTRSARWAGATLNSGPTDRRHRPQRGLAVIDHDRQRCASNGWPAASNMAAASLRRRCASASRCSALAMWARISTRDACHAVPSHSASDRSATFR
jgi:hypothetical protein